MSGDRGQPGLRFVGDIGNSRLKIGRIDGSDRLVSVVSLPLDDPSAWSDALPDRFSPSDAAWAISSVNPPLAARFSAFLGDRGFAPPRLYPSAALVPVPHRLLHPDRTGADRALAALAALQIGPRGRPGLVVSCGTAVTVERITPDGVWTGGVIAPGLSLMARAMPQFTAQLPLLSLDPDSSPAPWGDSTEPALLAGLYWGAVGSIREILRRQAEPDTPEPWRIWTGGDLGLAHQVEDSPPRIVPDLVLRGLAFAAFAVPVVESAP